MADNQNVELLQSEEDKKKKAAQSQPGSAFSASGPSAAPAAPASATQQARAAQAAGPTKGTGFTGVGRYLQANVGSRLGEQVAGRVAQTGQQAQTRLGQAVGQFGQQLGQQQQQLTQQQQLAQGALQRISGGISAPPASVEQEAKPIDLTPSQQEIAAYQAVSGGQFQAPTGLQDLADIQAQARTAQEFARGTETQKGRMGLLQQIVGRGPQQYTKGKSALDALILGQAGGQLASARRGTAGLERQITQQEKLAGEQARQFGAEAQKAKGELSGKAGELETPLTSDISKRLEEFQKQRPQFIEDLKTAIDRGELTEEQAMALGIGEQGLATSGITKQELKNLITSGIGASDITAQAISSPEQAAKLNALYKLLGKDQFATAEQLKKAGSLKDIKQDIGFDLEKAKEAGATIRTLPQAQTEFESAKNAVLDKTKGFINSPVTGLTMDKNGNPTKESAQRSMNYFRSIQDLQSDAGGRIAPEQRARWKDIADTLEAYLKSQDVLYGQPIRVLSESMGGKLGKTPAISPIGTKK